MQKCQHDIKNIFSKTNFHKKDISISKKKQISEKFDFRDHLSHCHKVKKCMKIFCFRQREEFSIIHYFLQAPGVLKLFRAWEQRRAEGPELRPGCKALGYWDGKSEEKILRTTTDARRTDGQK